MLALFHVESPRTANEYGVAPVLVRHWVWAEVIYSLLTQMTQTSLWMYPCITVTPLTTTHGFQLEGTLPCVSSHSPAFLCPILSVLVCQHLKTIFLLFNNSKPNSNIISNPWSFCSGYCCIYLLNNHFYRVTMDVFFPEKENMLPES